MRNTVAFATALILSLAAHAQTPQPAAPSAVNDWIRANAIPLATPIAGNGFKDMQPLKQVIGDARIVSLGEATHGSREFFQLKHRMLEFLATEMGFTIFSIEANMPEADKLNDFVLNGTGDPLKLIKGMYFWTWDTEEVLDMVLWMREFNKSGKGRVEFTGFDMQTPNVALQLARDFVTKAEPSWLPVFNKAAALALAPSAQQSAFGTATHTLPAELFRGKHIRLSGYIKTESVSQYAGFWWRADSKQPPPAFANLGTAAPKGTTDWRSYHLDLEIPESATAIYFGPLLAGTGTAWFDDLQIEIDGKPYVGDQYDFTFEGPSFKGFGMGTPAYPMRLDDKVAHGGKQSLRIASAAVAPNAIDPKVASAEWAGVVSHLEANRDTYDKTVFAAKEVDWAIQNARVVLQCMQMRANQVSRDTSMANNVKWILDHSPNARIVLWAHNGHVMTHYPGSMGSVLRTLFGDQVAVFGFSFNEGSFQAISQSKGLTNFTVPPAPPGSLDATLAAAGPPLFALDLRALPKSGGVADWFLAPHDTRSIGAIYPDNQPFAFLFPQVAPSASDVLLFVNKTTAARKNPGIASNFDFRRGDPKPADASPLAEFHDPDFTVSLHVPAGWTVGDAFRWGNRETTARINILSAGAGQLPPSLYYRIHEPETREEAAIYESLLKNPASKVTQRVKESIADYHIRPDSTTRRKINGRPAVTCIADFKIGDIKTSEYLTWISGTSSSALIFARSATADLDTLRKTLDPVIDSLKLP